jgi:hypothetical protein
MSPEFAEYFKLSILFIFIVTLPSSSLFYLKVGRLCQLVIGSLCGAGYGKKAFISRHEH